MTKNIYPSGAIFSGGLLAMMIFLNGELARYTSPALSSLIAHFMGIWGSWLLWKFMARPVAKRYFPTRRTRPSGLIWVELAGQ